MPEFEIVIESKTLGRFVERKIFANVPEEALDEFLATLEPHGVKRTGGATATFLNEVEVSVKPYIPTAEERAARERSFAAGLNAWDKKHGASRREAATPFAAPGPARWQR